MITILDVTNGNLRAGWDREQLGDLAGAKAHYRQWTATGLDTGEGWFRLGVVSLKLGDYQSAAEALATASRLPFKPAETLNLLGVAQAGLGDKARAESSFRAAIALVPRFVDAHVNLGRALLEQHKLTEAEAALRFALELDPRRIAAWENLASVYIELRQPAEAVEALQSLLKIVPQHVAAIVQLAELLMRQGRLADAEEGLQLALQFAPQRAELHVGLGVILTEKKQLASACRVFEQATKLDPRSAAAFSNLGNALRELGQYEPAQACLERALHIDPRDPFSLANMGTLCLDRRQYDRAEEHFLRALEQQPAGLHALVGMAALHTMRGQPELAQELLRRVVEREPQLVQAQMNLASLELLLGDWKAGFERYEWRWRLTNVAEGKHTQPAWDGTPAPGKTLFLHCEQGLGDTLQFCRYASLARSRVERVVLQAPRALHRLLGPAAGVDELVAPDQSPLRYDYHLPLLSLPRIFNVTPDDVVVQAPYLAAEPTRVAIWQPRFTNTEQFRVGVVWRGNPKYRGDQERSVELDRFEVLARMPRVQLFALQKEAVGAEIARVADRFAVVDLAAELDNDGNAFVDTAAVMTQLDLVISVDSAPAHLAGALGVPVWLLLSHIADWRWMQNRSDTPWYPSMRLFRQPASGDWDSVFERVAAELLQLLNQRR